MAFRIFAALACAFAFTAAQAASVRVTFEQVYEAGLFSDKPSADVRDNAVKVGKQEVWKSYLAKVDSSKLSAVEKHRAALEKRLDEIVVSIDILDEQVLKEARRIRYTVRGNVNDGLVDSIIASAAGGGAKTGEGSAFGFLILPRLQAEAKSFDSKLSKKVGVTGAKTNEKVSAEQISDSGSGMSERSLEADKIKVKLSSTSSGSKTRKAQQVKWVLGDAKNVDSTVSKYLSEAGYETSSYADVAAECGSVKTAEARNDLLESETAELSDDIRALVFKAMRSCEMRFFGMGTVDIDSIESDTNSGGVRARANVNIQVYDLKGRLPRKVASVGPVAFYGVGPAEDGARDSAISEAGREAAKIIVTQMREKGLQ